MNPAARIRVGCFVLVAVAPALAAAAVTESQVRAELASLAAAPLAAPVTLEYCTQPEAFSRKYSIATSLPIRLEYRISDADAVVSSTASGWHVTIVSPTVRVVSTPTAFDDGADRNATWQLNRADGRWFAANLAVHAKILSAWIADPATNPQLVRGLEAALSEKLSSRLRTQGEARAVHVHLATARSGDAALTDLELCAGSSVTARFPAAFPVTDFSARGVFTEDASPEQSKTTVPLKNRAGKVIAIREVDALLDDPVGRFAITQGPTEAPALNGRAGTRIIGGSPVPEGLMPWAVAFAREVNGKLANYCGGTLIAPHWVLTAAHCRIRPGDIAIIGRTKISGTGGDQKRVRLVWQHADFGKLEKYDADIALARLEADTTMKITAVHKDVLPAQTKVVVAGWGATRPGGGVVDELSSVPLEVTPDATCEFAYSQLDAHWSPNMICANAVVNPAIPSAPADACQGDSGGGMFFSPRTEVYEIAGVVSFGKGCAEKAFPGVYTRMSVFWEWKDEVLEAARAGEGT